MRALNIIDDTTAELYTQLSKGAVRCYPAKIIGISDPNAFGTIEYTVVPEFGPDAYHEEWVESKRYTNHDCTSLAATYQTIVRRYDLENNELISRLNPVTISNYGSFVTSAYSLPFYQQIQSKMYDELTASDTSVVWKIVF